MQNAAILTPRAKLSNIVCDVAYDVAYDITDTIYDVQSRTYDIPYDEGIRHHNLVYIVGFDDIVGTLHDTTS